MRSERRTFTLLEIMVVIVVVAILAAISTNYVISATEKTKVSEAINVLGAVRNAQIRYYVFYGSLTDTLDNLDAQYTDMKFFSQPQAFGPIYEGEDEDIASVQRNNNGNPGYGQYILTIHGDASITCDANGGECPRGYSHH